MPMGKSLIVLDRLVMLVLKKSHSKWRVFWSHAQAAQALDHVFLRQASILLDADEIMNDLTNDLNGADWHQLSSYKPASGNVT